MRTLLALVTIVMATASVINAQVPRQQRTTRTSPVELVHTNYGITGFDVANGISGGFWPRGSNQQFLFGAGLWIGGLLLDVNDSLQKAVFTTYDPNTGRSAATPLSELDVTDALDIEVMRSRFTDTVLTAYDYPADHVATRYPMGMEISQELVTHTSGQFKDVAVLSTTIKNIHPTRTIQQLIVDLFMDPDVGPRNDYMLAAREDYLDIIEDPDELGIVKIGSKPHKGISYGKIGVALVKTPDYKTAATIRNHPLELDPNTSEERYTLISSGVRALPKDTGEVRIHIASAGYTLEPGQELTFRFLLMFSDDDDAIAVPWMIDMVKQYRTFTDVRDGVVSDVVRIHPNPVSEGGTLRLTAQDTPQHVVITDAMGRTLRTLNNDCSTIDVMGLPAGMYYARVHHGARVETVPVVVVK